MQAIGIENQLFLYVRGVPEVLTYHSVIGGTRFATVQGTPSNIYAAPCLMFMGFVDSPAISPELPARCSSLTLLFVFEGDAEVCSVFRCHCYELRLLRVDDGNRVNLALVEISHGDLLMVLDHCRRRVERQVVV
jgi:hypothetical protein